MKQILSLLSLALLLSACGTYLTQSENVSKQKKAYSKVWVLAWSENRIARSLFERDLVEALGKKGIPAVRSLDAGIDIPIDHKPSETESAAIGSQLRAQGFEGVVVTHLVNTEDYREVIPGSYSTGYYPAYSLHFGRFMGYYPASAWQPDRLVTGTRYVIESALYDLSSPKDENLQWLGRFVVEDPTDIEKTTARYARELATALVASNMAAPDR